MLGALSTTRALVALLVSLQLVAGAAQPKVSRVRLGANVGLAPKWDPARDAGPLGRGADALFMARFRSKLAAEYGRDSAAPAGSYEGITELIVRLHERDGRAALVEGASRRVLASLFPNWPPFNPRGTVGLLFWFGVLFARPFPAFSAKLNTWVTWLAAQWLMGHCEIRDLTAPDDVARLAVGDGKAQLLHVSRCRYLEETKCAAICVNTCKMPTQAFFNVDMHVPVSVEPDYASLSCAFKFGIAPTADDEAAARGIACFDACPSRGGAAPAASALLAPAAPSRCARMG